MMTFEYKNTEAALHAYIAALSDLKLGQGFFAKLNIEYSRLTVELFKCLFQTNSLERKYEFLNDLKMFIDDMIRKYSTTSPYGYSPRSPYEKRMGILHKKQNKTKDSYHECLNIHEEEYKP
mgnify:CR=1 FL=1